jgi:hypothetical protein
MSVVSVRTPEIVVISAKDTHDVTKLYLPGGIE